MCGAVFVEIFGASLLTVKKFFCWEQDTTAHPQLRSHASIILCAKRSAVSKKLGLDEMDQFGIEKTSLSTPWSRLAEANQMSYLQALYERSHADCIQPVGLTTSNAFVPQGGFTIAGVWFT